MFTSKSKNIEYQTTIHFFDSVIPKDSRILELGAGGGIYTEYLAKQNHSILSSDIVPEYVEIIKTRCSNYKNVDVQIINALELNNLGNNEFDVILCMGPYYHLQNETEREKVLSNCKNLLKKNGLLIVSYINKYFALALYLMYGKKMSPKEYELFAQEKYSELAHVDGFMGFSHYTTPDKIENEILKYQYKIENHIGVDGIYNLISEQIEKMNENEFSDFLNYHYEICSEKSILGNSSHGLVFCRKE
jgi:SAM-dependent methyltransferase